MRPGLSDCGKPPGRRPGVQRFSVLLRLDDCSSRSVVYLKLWLSGRTTTVFPVVLPPISASIGTSGSGYIGTVAVVELFVSNNSELRKEVT